jgi:hypothetical protein
LAAGGTPLATGKADCGPSRRFGGGPPDRGDAPSPLGCPGDLLRHSRAARAVTVKTALLSSGRCHSLRSGPERRRLQCRRGSRQCPWSVERNHEQAGREVVARVSLSPSTLCLRGRRERARTLLGRRSRQRGSAAVCSAGGGAPTARPGQASHVLHCDELEAGLPMPGHASGRVRDGPSAPLTPAVIDTAGKRTCSGSHPRIGTRALKRSRIEVFARPTRTRSPHTTGRPQMQMRTALYRNQKLPLLRPGSVPKR